MHADLRGGDPPAARASGLRVRRNGRRSRRRRPSVRRQHGLRAGRVVVDERVVDQVLLDQDRAESRQAPCVGAGLHLQVESAMAAVSLRRGSITTIVRAGSAAISLSTGRARGSSATATGSCRRTRPPRRARSRPWCGRRRAGRRRTSRRSSPGRARWRGTSAERAPAAPCRRPRRGGCPGRRRRRRRSCRRRARPGRRQAPRDLGDRGVPVDLLVGPSARRRRGVVSRSVVLVAVEPQRLLAGVALRGRVRLVAADLARRRSSTCTSIPQLHSHRMQALGRHSTEDIVRAGYYDGRHTATPWPHHLVNE